jgi:fatty-acyl-CoA synthase
VYDGYGSTEGGVVILRIADMPKGALGVAAEDTKVLDPETGEECPRATFDEERRLLNANEAIGELVNTSGVSSFEGYWRNEEANRARVRDGIYRTGDLA